MQILIKVLTNHNETHQLRPVASTLDYLLQNIEKKSNKNNLHQFKFLIYQQSLSIIHRFRNTNLLNNTNNKINFKS